MDWITFRLYLFASPVFALFFWLMLDWICPYVIRHPGSFWLPCFGLLVGVSCGLYFVFLDRVCLLMRPYLNKDSPVCDQTPRLLVDAPVCDRHPGAFWLPRFGLLVAVSCDLYLVFLDRVCSLMRPYLIKDSPVCDRHPGAFWLP